MANKREICEKYKISGGWFGAFASCKSIILNMVWMILFIVAMCMTMIYRQAITS